MTEKLRVARPQIGATHSVYFQDEVRGVPTGERDVELTDAGPRWVRFLTQYPLAAHRVPRATWDALRKREVAGRPPSRERRDEEMIALKTNTRGDTKMVPDTSRMSIAAMLEKYNEMAKAAGKKLRRGFSDRAAAEKSVAALAAEVGAVTAAPPPKKVASGGHGKDPKKVSDFRTVRAGTTRARVVELCDGKKTVDQVAAAIGGDRKKVLAHLHCLWRDCGVGYSVGEDDRAVVLFPGSKTRADMVAEAK